VVEMVVRIPMGKPVPGITNLIPTIEVTCADEDEVKVNWDTISVGYA